MCVCVCVCVCMRVYIYNMPHFNILKTLYTYWISMCILISLTLH